MARVSKTFAPRRLRSFTRGLMHALCTVATSSFFVRNCRSIVNVAMRLPFYCRAVLGAIHAFTCWLWKCFFLSFIFFFLNLRCAHTRGLRPSFLSGAVLMGSIVHVAVMNAQTCSWALRCDATINLSRHWNSKARPSLVVCPALDFGITNSCTPFRPINEWMRRLVILIHTI